jgi:hypothetical protein
LCMREVLWRDALERRGTNKRRKERKNMLKCSVY